MRKVAPWWFVLFSELAQLSGRFQVTVFPGGFQKFYAQDCASFAFSENMIVPQELQSSTSFRS